MGNLVGYGLNATAKGHSSVEGVVNKAKGIFASDQSDRYLTKFIDELRIIKNEVLKNEQAFYLKCGVSSLQQLNAKLDALSRIYEPFLAGGAALRQIGREIDFTNITIGATDEEIEEQLEEKLNYLIENSPDKAQILQENIALALGKNEGNTHALDGFIQKYFRFDKNGKSKRFITSRGGQKVGLGKFTITYDEKEQKFRVKVNGAQISSTFRAKLSELLDNIVGDNRDKAKGLQPDELRQKINKIALRFITDATAKQIVSNIMETQGYQFDLNASFASVTGYLGEIRAVALLKQLLPNDNSIRGTGNLRDAAKKQEIPIDVVCESCGFQIKNYTLKDGKVTFSNEGQPQNIMANRFRISGQLYDILLDLFAAYQYNRPIKHDPDGNLGTYTAIYNSIYNNNMSVFYMMKPLFDARVPQMMKISQEFSVEETANNKMFIDKAVYFNTFFWINKHLVPSSEIIDQILKSMSPTNFANTIDTTYTLSSTDNNYIFEKRPSLVRDKDGNLVGTSIEEALKKLKLKYEITLDLSRFKI